MPETKKKKGINWTGLFHIVWLLPMGIGIITTFLKLVKVLNVSWLIATSPLIFSYSFFTCVIIYVALFHEKILKLFKK